MARCGCATAQSTTCEAIMSCIAANLGPGLDLNESTGQLELRLSTDAGNVASIGSDSGFYSPAGSAPGPMSWPKTVATLPAQAIGSTGGGNMVLPSTAPGAVEYAIGHDVDIFLTSACAGSDGTALEIIDERDDPINRYTDNPSVIAWGRVASVQTSSLGYDAGTRVSPTARNAPSAFTSPDGGWGGFYAHPFRVRTVSELLRMVRGRMVVAIIVNIEGLTTDAEVIAEVEAVVRAVVEANAQDWVIILPEAHFEADGRKIPLDQIAPIITGAGIAAGLNIFTETEPDTFSPAEIVAAGATWVQIASPSHPDGASAARIGEFIAAGLQAIVYTNGRQYWTAWAFGIGARAVRSGDPVYAKGGRGQPGDLAYRQTFIPGLATRTAVIGGMTPLNSTSTAVFNQGFARQDEPGRWFPERYAWDGGLARVTNNALLGTICPIPNTTDYRIHIRVWRPEQESSITTAAFAGIFFAAADDRDISNFADNQIGYSAQVHPYADIASWDNMEIVRHDGGGFNTILATSGNAPPGWGYEEWTDLEVTVQGTTITFTASNSTGTNTISADDTAYRGTYAHYIWYETAPRPIIHAYDNPTDLVMYEALS